MCIRDRLKAGEIEEEPAQPFIPRQGPAPSGTRSIGCQADFGRESLIKRLKKLSASKERWSEMKRKRKLEAESQRQPEAANTSSAAQASPTPPSEVQRPAFMQAKRPRIAPPAKPQPTQVAEVAASGSGARQRGGGKPKPSRGGRNRGTAAVAAKDQRVVVVVPPQAPTVQAKPPSRDEKERSRSPRSRSPRGQKKPPHPPLHQQLPTSNQGQRYRSCLLYTSPSPRDATLSRMPSSA